MDNQKGIEVEEKCILIFRNLGWEIEVCAPNKPYDFLLKIDGDIKGGVECFFVANPKMLDKVLKSKVQRIQRIIDTEKPGIFILTNGELFDVYYDGRFSGTLTTPPNPNDYYLIRRLSAYYYKLHEVKKDEY